MIKKLPLLLGLLLCFTIKAQQYKVIDSLLNDYNIDGARAIISKTSYKDSSEKLLDNAQYYVFTNQLDSAFINLFNVDTLSLSPINKARYLDYLGKTHIADDDIDKGYLYSIRAKEQYLKVKELYDANAFNLTLYNLFADQEYYNYEPDQLLELFGEQAIENEWNDQVADYYIQIALLNFNYDNKKEVMQSGLLGVDIRSSTPIPRPAIWPCDLDPRLTACPVSTLYVWSCYVWLCWNSTGGHFTC